MLLMDIQSWIVISKHFSEYLLQNVKQCYQIWTEKYQLEFILLAEKLNFYVFRYLKLEMVRIKFITFLYFPWKDIKILFNVQIPVDTKFIGTCSHNLFFFMLSIFLATCTRLIRKIRTQYDRFDIMLNQRSLWIMSTLLCNVIATQVPYNSYDLLHQD